jgi:3-oxo-5alpha-steroid 4-dehydrogenase
MDELVADVVVVGFGAAGACAAIEAADAGRRRAGAGPVRRRRRHRDVRRRGLRRRRHPAAARGRRHRLPEAMFDYLRLEVGDAGLRPATLRGSATAAPA